jgi:mannose/cellobiose epimerase-like protein (N-acyl-D-glucosamine 2-epimerase family)
MIYIYAKNYNQLYGSSINVDVQLKTMEAASREPENSGWYKTIQNSNGVSFNASKDFYQHIQ